MLSLSESDGLSKSGGALNENVMEPLSPVVVEVSRAKRSLSSFPAAGQAVFSALEGLLFAEQYYSTRRRAQHCSEVERLQSSASILLAVRSAGCACWVEL